LRLANDLRRAGANIWLDQLDIKPGTRWDSSIEKALKSSKSLLVILSNTAVASHNVMDEVSYALEKNKNVVPVLLEECEIPFRLKRLQYADFTSDYQKGLKTLANALHLDEVTAEKLTEIGIGSTAAPEKKLKKPIISNTADKPKVETSAPHEPQKAKTDLKEKQDVKAVLQEKKSIPTTSPAATKPKSKIGWYVGGGFVLLLALLGIFWTIATPDQNPINDTTDDLVTVDPPDDNLQDTESDAIEKEKPLDDTVEDNSSNKPTNKNSSPKTSSPEDTIKIVRPKEKTPPVSSPAIVNGTNVRIVQYTNGEQDPSGYFRQKDGTNWEEESIVDDHITAFEEFDRDEWIVHLIDRTRDMTIHLDLQNRQVLINMYKPDRGVLYAISDAKSIR